MARYDKEKLKISYQSYRCTPKTRENRALEEMLAVMIGKRKITCRSFREVCRALANVRRPSLSCIMFSSWEAVGVSAQEALDLINMLKTDLRKVV